jgi:hypothetical protein
LPTPEDLATERLVKRLQAGVRDGQALGGVEIEDAFKAVLAQATKEQDVLGGHEDDPSRALSAYLQAPWFRGLGPE